MSRYARGLAARGVDVVTFNFPYMEQRRKIPDRAPVLEAAFRDAIAAATSELPGRRLFIGGKSMGGRIATHLAAQRQPGLNGVVALGYPLHPPGKPQELRTAHLPDIKSPVLIVQGERDTFGTRDEIAAAVALMRAPVTLHIVEGGDHSLTVRGRRPADDDGVIFDVIAGWMARQTA